MNLSSFSVPDPSYTGLDDFHVMGVNFHESDNDCIDFHVTVVDTFTPARFGKLTTLHFIAEPQMNPVIVTEIIEPADRDEMTFNRDYVKSITAFEFQTDYSYSNYEIPIDEGRMSRIEINTEQFDRIDSLEVQKNGKL